ANHVSNLDTPIILTALPTVVRRRTVVAAAMDNFFMRPSTAARTILMFNAIPIDRHRVNRRSSDLALEVLREGWNLLIFPEGGRSPTGNLQEFKGGAAFLAERVGAPVVPVYVAGAGELRGPKYAKAPRFTDVPWQNRRKVSVTFGAPLVTGADETVRRFNARIEDAVVALGRQATGDDTLDVERRD
ncbi:MAG TPA: lysophospholipid acyltransferase family protein, partial [Acidimicrobiales bacterium]|nr:lysophospholipid acyltransferase family protein [Acidimicrobiales bacterium]